MKITVKNLQKKIRIGPSVLLRLKRIIAKILTQEGFNCAGEITVCLMNDAGIREINLMYLARYCPTDVIAFNLGKTGKAPLLADIVVSTDTAARAAKIFKTTPLDELYLYVIHGVLHILGYSDKSAKGAAIMRKKEWQYLRPKQ